MQTSSLLPCLAAALALACAACSSNPAQGVQAALANASAQLAAAQVTAQNTVAASGLTQAQLAALNQFVASDNLTAEQRANIQAFLRQGTLNDQAAGLTLQQQQQNTSIRIAFLQALFGQNAGILTNLTP